MTNRTFSLTFGLTLLALTPLLLSVPAFVPGIDGLFPFLGAVATFYLGLQLYCGELSEV